MQQIPLDIQIEPEYFYGDFIISIANLEAYRAVNSPEIWPNKRILLVGEEGSGKTHLVSIYKSLFAAIPFQDFDTNYAPGSKIYLENIEEIDEPEFLFHLINFAANNGLFLLLTTDNLPSYRLKDLQSRINSTLKVLIKKPDETLLKVIIQKHFSDKQLKISNDNIEYIMNHSERSFTFIKSLTNTIDKITLEKKKRLTLPVIKEALQRIQVANA